jgi:L-iditol 2-dehydrogenase
LKAVKRLNLLKGDSVLVAGQGPIGLMFTRLLALRGMRVTATDLLETRLAMAKEFGATETIQVGTGENRENREKAVLTTDYTDEHGSKLRHKTKMGAGDNRESPQKGETAKYAKYTKTEHRYAGAIPHSAVRTPHLFDAAVIAVPSDAVVREAQDVVRGGGQVLLFSHTRRGAESAMDLAKICVDEKDLIGSYSADFLLQKEVARLVFSRKLDVRKLITNQFPLERTAEAVALAAKPTAESLKVVVTPTP